MKIKKPRKAPNICIYGIVLEDYRIQRLRELLHEANICDYKTSNYSPVTTILELSIRTEQLELIERLVKQVNREFKNVR